MSDLRHGEPLAKQRNIDPIARTDHPWDLPATVPLPHRCDCPVYGDQLWRASGFIVEFDESSMIGTIFSCATVSEHIPMFPKIDKIRVYLFDGTSYDATIEACDNHWNLLVLSVSFGRAVKTMNMVEISENRNAMDVHLQGFVLQPHSASERLCPGDTIIGLGRQSTEPFGLQANCGVYRRQLEVQQ
ncbi:unnamed protein product [Triticum turgidum subsp. durum]|uniref:Uncharacterized protein n=1 Tax=Triticum turgidum subsp. durum TaxID=4567 RepID=A0A9R1B9G9_TRITD|nr:unnamed protein product [Triticum turgidum subsp. durum]